MFREVQFPDGSSKKTIVLDEKVTADLTSTSGGGSNRFESSQEFTCGQRIPETDSVKSVSSSPSSAILLPYGELISDYHPYFWIMYKDRAFNMSIPQNRSDFLQFAAEEKMTKTQAAVRLSQFAASNRLVQ